MSTSDKDFADKAKAQFDESVERLDGATLSRLNRGREAALDAARDRRQPWVYWLPATGAAAAVVIALTMTMGPEAPVDTPVADFEILLGEESIEMYEELEFYAWLESTDFEANGEG